MKYIINVVIVGVNEDEDSPWGSPSGCVPSEEPTSSVLAISIGVLSASSGAAFVRALIRSERRGAGGTTRTGILDGIDAADLE